MAKDKITEYDATANNNTVVGDVNLAENSALPSDMNNAIREVMSHQKEAFGSGTPLFVDQTNNRVGVNKTPTVALDVSGQAIITTTDNSSTLTLTSTDADSSSAPTLVLNRDSSSPADGDNIGLISFKAENDVGGSRTYAQIQGKINDQSEGSIDAELEILTLVGDNSRSRLEILPTEIVFNEDAQALNFRVESNSNANMLFVDGGNNKVGIGTNSPAINLETSGSMAVSDTSTATKRLQLDSGASEHTINSANYGTEMMDLNIQSRLLIFKTGAIGVVEHARMDTNGQLFFGCTSTTGGVPNEDGIVLQKNGNQKYRASSIGNAVNQFYNSNGVLVAQITVGSSGASLANTSDYRLKENVDYNFDATSRIKQLKPCRFNFKTDANNTIDGFLAHEVSSIVPEAVSGKKDAMTEEVLYVDGDEIPDGKKVGDIKEASRIDPQGIDHSKIVPLLVKTIQELEARITALESA